MTAKYPLICLFLAILVLLPTVRPASTPLTLGPSIKYSQAGTAVFPTSTYTGPNTVNPLTYRITLPRAMNDTNYETTIATQTMSAQLNGKGFSLYLFYSGQNQNRVDIEIYSYQMRKIQSLSIRWIVFDTTWTVFVGYYYLYEVSRYISSSSPYPLSLTGIFAVNMTGTVRTFTTLTGFQITADSTSYDLSLILTAQRTSSTKMTGALSSKSSSRVYVGYISFSFISFNVGLVTSKPALLTMGTFSATNNGPLSYLDTGGITRDYNVIWGLTGFHFTNQAFISWTSTLTPSTSIDVTSSNSFLYLQFIYLILQQYWCQPPIIYLLQANNTCYDVCPNRYYSKDVSLTCQKCKYDCYTCVDYSSNCSSCSYDVDHREINTANNRCKPVDRYYDDGVNALALPCPAACLTCSSATTCLTCQPGYRKSGSSCLPCPSNCLTCSSATTCSLCNTSYTLLNNTCSLSCNNYIDYCNNCSVVNSSLQCDVCQNGTYNNYSACYAQCGDGQVGGQQQCDDGDNTNYDGCSYNCTIQPSYYCSANKGNISICTPCPSNCLTCTISTCTSCLSIYTLTPAQLCQLDCPNLINNCSTCSYVSGNVSCDVCEAGLSFSNGSCVVVCGDGLKANSQQCDDGDVNGADGCSSMCTIESGYYCEGAVGNISICGLCQQHCLNCTSATACTLCSALTSLTNDTCLPDCSIVPDCQTCTLPSTTILCSTCSIGFTVDLSSNTCNATCGDGIVVSSQQCDDNNTLGTDGCSSQCQFQPGFFCQSSPSKCYPCLQYCLSCYDNISCIQCNNLTLWNRDKVQCIPNCFNVEHCNQCQLNDKKDQVMCTNCTEEYYVQAGVCLPVCGDGVFVDEEECQDGNTNKGDGCDDKCNVEQYFNCTVANATGLSQCFLTQCSLTLVNTIKTPGQNTGTFTFQPSPPGLPVLSTINWTNIISINDPDIQVTNVKYDPSAGQVKLDFKYKADISKKEVKVKINTTQSTALSQLPPFSVAFAANSDNNAAFAFYSDQQYTLGRIVSYVATMVGIMAIVCLIAGLFGGRLIGLQCAAVIQIAFVSLLALNDLSPTFTGLQSLGHCFGYNKLQSYNINQDIDRPYRASQLSRRFINNYNITGLAIIIPLIISTILRCVSRFQDDKQKRSRFHSLSCLAIGQYTLYCFLAFSYLSYLALFISVKYIGNDIMDYCGLAAGMILLGLGIVYAIVYCRANHQSQYFSQFKNKFQPQGFPQRFYLFPMAERILVPGAMVALSSLKYGNGVIIAVYAILIAVLLKSQPYIGQRKNYRPFANYLIVIVIEGVYMGTTFTADPSGLLALYGPFLVLGLLLISIIYSVYALVIDLKKNTCSSEQEKEHSAQKLSEQRQMREFTARFLAQDNSCILRKFSTDVQPNNVENDANKSQLRSPSRLQMTLIKEQLQQLKNSQIKSDRNVSILDRQAMQGHLQNLLEELQDDDWL